MPHCRLKHWISFAKVEMDAKCNILVGDGSKHTMEINWNEFVQCCASIKSSNIYYILKILTDFPIIFLALHACIDVKVIESVTQL